jgi:glycosyltransferase involved in cell wall biosynthesis
MAARFCAQKDHLLLLEALAGVEGTWQLVLAGDGPARKDAELAAQKLKLAGRVQFVGDCDDIPALLADADIFVLASKWEGLPLSILEAMRAGLPVIATNVGGVGELITDGINGYLTERGNVAQMRNRIQALVSSPALRHSMAHEARRRFEQDFQLDVMVRKTMMVYRQTLADKRTAIEEAMRADSLEV